MGKAAAKAFVRTNINQITGAVRWAVQTVLGGSINLTSGALGNLLLGNAWCLTSPGGMVALAADYFSDNLLNDY